MTFFLTTILPSMLLGSLIGFVAALIFLRHTIAQCAKDVRDSQKAYAGAEEFYKRSIVIYQSLERDLQAHKQETPQ